MQNSTKLREKQQNEIQQSLSEETDGKEEMFRIERFQKGKKLGGISKKFSQQSKLLRCRENHKSKIVRSEGSSVATFGDSRFIVTSFDYDDDCSTKPLSPITTRIHQESAPVGVRDDAPGLENLGSPKRHLMRIHSRPADKESNSSDDDIMVVSSGSCINTLDSVFGRRGSCCSDDIIMLSGRLSLSPEIDSNSPSSMDESHFENQKDLGNVYGNSVPVVTKMPNTLDEDELYDDTIADTELERIYEANHDHSESELVMSVPSTAADKEDDVCESVVNIFNGVDITDSPSFTPVNLHQSNYSSHIEASPSKFPDLCQTTGTYTNVAALMTMPPRPITLAMVNAMDRADNDKVSPLKISTWQDSHSVLPDLSSHQHTDVMGVHEEEGMVDADDDNVYENAEIIVAEIIVAKKRVRRRNGIIQEQQQQLQQQEAKLRLRLSYSTGNSPLDNEDYDYAHPIHPLEKYSLSPPTTSRLLVRQSSTGSDVFLPDTSSSPSSLLNNSSYDHADRRSGRKAKSTSCAPSSLSPSHVTSSVSSMHGGCPNIPVGVRCSNGGRAVSPGRSSAIDDPASFLKKKAANFYSVPVGPVVSSSSIRHCSAPLSRLHSSPIPPLSLSPVSPLSSSPLPPLPSSPLPPLPSSPLPHLPSPSTPSRACKMHMPLPPIPSSTANLPEHEVDEGEESEDYESIDSDDTDAPEMLDEGSFSFHERRHDSNRRPSSPLDYECVHSVTCEPLGEGASRRSSSPQHYTPPIQRKIKEHALVSSKSVPSSPLRNSSLDQDPISLRPPALLPVVVSSKRPPAPLPLEATQTHVTSVSQAVPCRYRPFPLPQSPVSSTDVTCSNTKSCNNGPLQGRGMSTTPLSRVNESLPLSPQPPHHRCSEITPPSVAPHSESWFSIPRLRSSSNPLAHPRFSSRAPVPPTPSPAATHSHQKKAKASKKPSSISDKHSNLAGESTVQIMKRNPPLALKKELSQSSSSLLTSQISYPSSRDEISLRSSLLGKQRTGSVDSVNGHPLSAQRILPVLRSKFRLSSSLHRTSAKLAASERLRKGSAESVDTRISSPGQPERGEKKVPKLRRVFLQQKQPKVRKYTYTSRHDNQSA